MDQRINIDSVLLENFDLLFNSLAHKDSWFQAELCSHYALLKVKLFERWGRMEDLEEAIKKGRHSVAGTTGNDEMLRGRLNNLGNMLSRRHEQTRETVDLEEAIQVTRRAVNSTPVHHPDLASMLSNLGNRLSRLYDCTNDLQDLEEAIQLARQAVDIMPRSDSHRALLLNNLRNKLHRRSERMGKIEDLEEEIQVAREIIQATPKHSPDLARRLVSLGQNIESRYKKAGMVEDLEECIGLCRHAVQIMHEDSPEMIDTLQHLGIHLNRRYEITGKMEDLEEAIQIASLVLKATPDGCPHFAGRLANLANGLFRRFEYLGKEGDIQEAIRLVRQAIHITPTQHQDVISMLGNLSRMLRLQYTFTGEIEGLEEATKIARQVVYLTPHDHPALAGRLNSLGQTLLTGHEHAGRTDDLEEAIQVMREAICITNVDLPDFSEMLTDLGGALRRRYERSGRGEDLEEAIMVARKVVGILPKDHRNLAGMLSNLSLYISCQYERTEKIEDLDEAIQIMREAITVAPKSYLNIGILLTNLGNQLYKRHEWTRDMDDLSQAIQVAREAVDSMPENHPNLSMTLKNLGNKLCHRYGYLKDSEDLEEAINVTQQAWRCQNATPFIRIHACTTAVLLLHVQNDFERAFELAAEAIHLLPYIHNRSLSQQDQQYLVSHFSGLAPLACSLALHTGKGQDTALELLEQSRGLILGLLMDDRSSTSELRAAHPKLCAQYESLRMDINKPVQDITDYRERNAASMSRTTAFQRLEECVQKIQKLPGFDRFHKNVTAGQMQDCALNGNIVIVNVTKLRSDAIIITASESKVLSLPTLSAHDAEDWIRQDLTKTSSNDRHRGRKNKAYLSFLSWLWRECVRPIMGELHYCVESSVENLPRIWWIGTGLASTFPFHAAGDSSSNVSYRAISSYTPTIKALQYTQKRSAATTSPYGLRKAVIVTMPETPGIYGLPESSVEAHEVIAAMKFSVSAEILEHPDVASTLLQLQECNIAHFACHGLSDPIDPSKSGLILRKVDKETNKLKQDMLTVQEVSQTHLLRAEIAYLSACSTAESKTEQLSDEILHVVSGFQVAGFRHVVGCLWPSYDKVCMHIAKSFYTELDEEGMSEHDRDRSVALALHKAVLQVRESAEHRNRPLSWVQYVHFGA